MKIGIHYDTGFFPGGRSSRVDFHPEQVKFDMNAITRDLRCAAVRITGGDPERLTVAAEAAVAAGLEVWFSPMPCELDSGEMLALLDDCAGRAETLRRQSSSNVVLVLGCGVSVFGRGFLPGADAYARIGCLSAPTPELFAEYPRRGPPCPVESREVLPGQACRPGNAAHRFTTPNVVSFDGYDGRLARHALLRVPRGTPDGH